MMQFTITSSEVTQSQRGPVCTVWLQADDGRVLPHVFALETLAWRAAEYGIDPADIDTLLDIVLHEVHGESSTLYDDPDTDTARKRHLARIAATKKSVQVIPPPAARGPLGVSPLQAVKDAHSAAVDPDDVAAKATAVEHTRARLRGAHSKPQKIPPTAPPARSAHPSA